MSNDEKMKEKMEGKEIAQHKTGLAPIYKGRKVSQFHIDFIKGILEKILAGDINTIEALKLLEQASTEANETILKDAGSIKRIVKNLLKDKPEELKKYNEIIKHNTGKRNPYKGKIGKPKIGTYHEEERKLKNEIIDTYLPQILSGETTFNILEKKLNLSHKTINKIIVEYYKEKEDSEGLENYRKTNKTNKGSLEARQSAKKMREEIEKDEIVSNAEFLLLSEEEQEKQVIMRVRKNKLTEELNERSNGKTTTRVTKEETTQSYIERIMNYFKSKNKEGSIIFSDADIRYMIFRYPTITNRSNDNLESKIQTLTSYEEIDEITAYGMIKQFPAIMGYETQRTKSQLDLLKKENLMDYIISNPSGLMRSVGLMYALIEYAKERHNNNLDGVNRNNIFLANKTLKRLYHTSNEELKTRFPYGNLEDEVEYNIDGEELGKVKPDILKLEEAEDVLNEALQKDKKESEKENMKNDEGGIKFD